MAALAGEPPAGGRLERYRVPVQKTLVNHGVRLHEVAHCRGHRRTEAVHLRGWRLGERPALTGRLRPVGRHRPRGARPQRSPLLHELQGLARVAVPLQHSPHCPLDSRVLSGNGCGVDGVDDRFQEVVVADYIEAALHNEVRAQCPPNLLR